MKRSNLLSFLYCLIYCLIFPFSLARAQSEGTTHAGGAIHGFIIDEQNTPLAGIAIRLAGTPYGTTTSETGRFKLSNIPAGTYTLEASGIGFTAQKQDIVLSSRSVLQITLQLNTANHTLEEVLVSASGEYYTPEIQTGKLSAELLTIPQSIKVVDRSLIEDRQALQFKEVIRNTPGVNLMSGSSNIMIRGYVNQGGSAAGSMQLINGTRNFFSGYTNDLNLTNIERIEIFKGPSAVLFGSNSPGGSVNALTKKPVGERYAAGVSYGTWGRYRVETDLSSTITKDQKLRYRFNAGYQNESDYRDFIYSRNLLIAPTIRFTPSRKTTLDVEFVHHQIQRSTWYDWGYPTWQEDVFALPITYTPHEPTDGVRIQNNLLLVSLEQKIASNLSFFSTYSGSNHRLDGQTHSPTFFNPIPGADSLVARVYRESQEDNTGSFLGNYLIWKPQVGKVAFTVTGGLDYFRTKYFYNINQAGRLEGVPALHVFQPKYRQKSVANYPTIGGFNEMAYTQFTGYYLMSRIDLGAKLNLMLSGRYDRYEDAAKTSHHTEAFLPNVGLVYQPWRGMSLYSSWTRGFLPQITQNPEVGGPFEPEYSEQLELGAKKEFFQGRLSATAAWYDITRRNVLVPQDPVNNPFGPKESTGKARSTGLELDVTGELLPNWNLTAGYAYNDSRITRSTYEFEVTRQANNAPYHTASLWTRYQLKEGVLQGLGLGAGVYYVGKRTTDGTLSFPSPQLQALPDYLTLDAGLYYRSGPLALQLNVDNLLNERYIYGASNAFYLQPGKPRNVLLRLQISY